MSRKTGLQVFNEKGEVYLDLTSRPTLYLGEADIYPTVSTGICSGEFGTRLPSEYSNYDLFYVIERIYASSVDFVNNNYELPTIVDKYDRSTNTKYFQWSYEDEDDINLPVRIRYGVF